MKMRNMEPIHVYISKGRPSKASTKVWLTRSGNCILENNKSKIPKNELNSLMDIIAKHYFIIIISKWMEYNSIKNLDDVKYFC